MKISWEKKDGKRTYYIDIDHEKVIVGSHAGSGHTDNASTCKYDELLKGKFHDHILRIFGQAILADVIENVEQALGYPKFVEKRNALKAAYDEIKTIRIDSSLADFLNHPDTENGFSNYGNAGGYKTIVRSDTKIFTANRDKGFLEDNDGNNRILIEFPGYVSGVVELRDYFYLVVSDDYVVLTPEGKLMQKELSIFGTYLRIKRVYRRIETICFSYRWFYDMYPNGWLQYEVGNGFIARWEEQ